MSINSRWPVSLIAQLQRQLKQDRVRMNSPDKVIAISGGVDPCHVGHLRMINAAAQHGKVVFILNSDEWLIKKKGYYFMPFDERREMLLGFENVNAVMDVDDSDGSVCEALSKLKPDYFGNGGDRTNKNTPEKELCQKLGIQNVWSLGGGKIQSSSELIQRVIDIEKSKMSKE